MCVCVYMYIYIYIYIYIKMSMSTKRLVFFRVYSFISFLHTCMFPGCCFRQRTYMAQGLVNETRTFAV